MSSHPEKKSEILMQNFLVILGFLLAIYSTDLSAQDDARFLGTWYRVSPDSVELQIEHFSADTFQFRMINWNPNVFGYMDGDDHSDYCYALIKGPDAYFNDAGAISDGRPLYYEGEDPCELLFRIVEEGVLEIYEENCYMIYGGAGATWGGVYTRVDEGKEWLSNIHP